MSSPYKPKSALPGSRSVGRQGALKPPSTSHSILMKKYKDDGKPQVQYVEQSTLLEPNNFIPSWEAGDEEKKEVSLTLRKLRIKYDNINKLVREKERELDGLKKKLEQKGEEEYKVEDTLFKKTNFMQTTEDELSMLKDEHDFELMFQRTYTHMLDRMKKDLIALQIYAKELQDSSKQKESIMTEETEKSRKAKENRMQAKYKLEELMKNIDQEQKKRQERILSLQKSIRNKEEALQRRMDRVRRQQEIAETAANENKDSNELKMQENYMVQKLWSSYLKKKMEKEMKRTYEIEDAFQKIRASTGFSDVQEIVHKFLTRENTYSQLLMAVSDNERKIDNLRRENEHWREKLHELQMQADGEEKKALTPELNALDQKITKLRKQCEKSEELNKKVNLVNDQVNSWTSRIVQKIDQQFNENIHAFEGNKTLAFIFERVAAAVCKQLEQQIIEDEDEEDKGYITVKDFMNDFATEEFLTKNIRVRPVSGITRVDQEETKTNAEQQIHFNPKSMLMGEQGDDEEKFNKMINLDMEEQRKNIKVKREEYMRRRQIEEEKSKKKN